MIVTYCCLLDSLLKNSVLLLVWLKIVNSLNKPQLLEMLMNKIPDFHLEWKISNPELIKPSTYTVVSSDKNLSQSHLPPDFFY